MDRISHCLAKLRLNEDLTRDTECKKAPPSDPPTLLSKVDDEDQMTSSIQTVGAEQSDGEPQTQIAFPAEDEEQSESHEQTQTERKVEIEGQTESGTHISDEPQIDSVTQNASSQSNVLCISNLQQQALTEFPKFEDLPKEIRFMIWNMHMQHPRIIELQSKIRTSNYRDPINQEPFQNWVRVSAPCRQPPAILHVCKEALVEALRHYSLTNFGTNPNPKLEQPIYYNPEVDIVYFGILSDIPAMRKTLNKNIVIPRVAVSIDTNKVPHRTAMRVLQGEEPSIQEGIKEITFVVGSYLWLKECNFDPESCFGTTENAGIDIERQVAHSTLQKLIKRVHRSHGLVKGAINNWTRDRIPSFEFKTLQPRPEQGKVYKSMYIPDEAPLNEDNWHTLRAIEERTGCAIKTELCDVDFYEDLWGWPAYEIGFYGTPCAVEKAIELTKDALEKKTKARLEAKKMEEAARRQITFRTPCWSRADETDWW